MLAESAFCWVSAHWSTLLSSFLPPSSLDLALSHREWGNGNAQKGKHYCSALRFLCSLPRVTSCLKCGLWTNQAAAKAPVPCMSSATSVSLKCSISTCFAHVSISDLRTLFPSLWRALKPLPCLPYKIRAENLTKLWHASAPLWTLSKPRWLGGHSACGLVLVLATSHKTRIQTSLEQKRLSVVFTRSEMNHSHLLSSKYLCYS